MLRISTQGAERHIQLGLVGALLAMSGFGLFNALTIPPFRLPDEQAHVGYAITLTRGELPTIETKIPRPEGSEALSLKLEADRRRRGSVWVANHPPGGYLLSLPMVAAADRLGHGDLANLALRVVNIVAAGLATLATFVLGRELVDAKVGLFAAALFVSFPSVSYLLSLGMTDGISLVATLTALVAAVRLLGKEADRRRWIGLSAALVFCGLTRLTALGVAVLLAGATLLVFARRERRVPWREGLLVGLPVLVLSGWFWAGNYVRYGDIAASKYLLQRFAREPTRTFFGTLHAGAVWEGVANRLLTNLVAESPVKGGMPGAGEIAFRLIELLILAATIRVGVLVVRDQRPTTAPPPAGKKLELLPWLALLLTFIVSWLMMAKHVSGGGNPHVRYLIVALPLIGVTVGTAIMRLNIASARWRRLPTGLAVAAIVGFFATRAEQTARFVDWMPSNTDAPLDSALNTTTGAPWIRIAALAVGTIGVALMASMVGIVLSRSVPAAEAESGGS